MNVTKSHNCVDSIQSLFFSSDEIDIYLSTSDYELKSHISGSSNITVDNLKSKIREKESIGHNIRLLYYGKELRGSALLSDYNIATDSNLVMTDTQGKRCNFKLQTFHM